MESNHQCTAPTNSNGERASNIQGALTPDQPVISYHRRYPDGEYVPVILSEGYGFIPQDDQLIVDYLNKEINKEDAPYIRIPKVNVYDHTPEELAGSHQSLGKDDWYFFSPRERKYFNGSRPNRAAGNGFWKATGADKRIYRNGKSVGSKKCLVFYEGKPKQNNKTTWIMHEYVAYQTQRRLPNGTGDMRLDDCVLCRIYKRSEYSPKEEKEAAASQSGEIANSSENKKQASPRRVKTEHEGTNQQHNLQVIQPSLSMPQQNLRVLRPSLSMESNHQCTVPANSNGERASNIQGALTPEEVLSKESYGPNNQPVISYHKRYPDGEYVPVILSVGYGFIPQDDQLIVGYLNKEINKEDAPYIRIPKINVYNHTPEELAGSHQGLGKDEWYFFSPRERKYFNGSRPNRAAGNGFWKATGADKRIYRNGKSVGSKKCLVFYEGKPKQSNKTTWIMHEYVADQPQRQRIPNGTGDMRLDDCVLCRIYKKSEYSSKEEKEAAASQSGEAAKSSENKKQAAPRRVKTEHEGTNQQHNLQVIQPSLPTQQQSLRVLQPNLSTLQQILQVIMPNSLEPWSNNLCGQLDFSMERNPEGAQPPMQKPDVSTPLQNPQATQNTPHTGSLQLWSNNLCGQPSLSMPQQNQQAIHYDPQPWSYNHGGQLDFRRESNPEDSLQPWSNNLCGQLDFSMERNPEGAQQLMQQPDVSMSLQNPQATQNTPHAGSLQPWSNNLCEQPSLSMPQQNQQATHYGPQPWSYNHGGQLDFRRESNPEDSLQPWSNNLCGQLDFSMERNPEGAQSFMQQPDVSTSLQNPQATQNTPHAGSLQPWSNNLCGQPSLSMPQQNQQAIHYGLQPWSYNHGGRLDFRRENNPEEAQPSMLQANRPTPQQNPQATQYSPHAGSQYLGEQLDSPMESILEQENQLYFNGFGKAFGDSIPMDTVGNLTFPPVFQNGFNDFYHLPPMDSFDPIPPSLGNNDHPQNGSLIQGDELVFPKAGTSDNAYNPGEKS